MGARRQVEWIVREFIPFQPEGWVLGTQITLVFSTIDTLRSDTFSRHVRAQRRPSLHVGLRTTQLLKWGQRTQPPTPVLPPALA